MQSVASALTSHKYVGIAVVLTTTISISQRVCSTCALTAALLPSRHEKQNRFIVNPMPAESLLFER